MNPFTINVPVEKLTDLRIRLSRTRWPDEIKCSEWDYGTNLEYLKNLCWYWQNDFDWVSKEKILNSYNQFLVDIEGQTVHFIYQKGKGKTNLPLMLIHGWPDSFYRFLKVIEGLSEPDENGVAYDVIVPSIPGFGFSEQPRIRGFGPAKIGSLFNKLMEDILGYITYFIHGGDWGASIATNMALQNPDHVRGLHLTNVPPEIFYGADFSEFNEDEKAYLAQAGQLQKKEGGYLAIQSSKPQTVAYGLNDSPSGLAGWIIEKFHSWTDNQGGFKNNLTKDDLLINLSIYWFTETAGSSAKLYYEAMQQMPEKNSVKIEVPTYFSIFPADPIKIPESFGHRIYNTKQWIKKDQGGHFPALEVPETFIKDIRKAFS